MIWDEIKQIEGKQLQDIGRAIDIIWLAIGENIERMIANKMRLRSTYAIHLSCACRLIGADREILFAGDDKYCPIQKEPYDENFNWDVQGNNLFDHKAKNWFLSNKPIFISSVEMSRLGDLKIFFGNGHLLEAFVSYSEEESWRFFEPGVNVPHLVVSGNNIEYV